jgi:chromate transport protein ChrA
MNIAEKNKLLKWGAYINLLVAIFIATLQSSSTYWINLVLAALLGLLYWKQKKQSSKKTNKK